MSGQVGEGRYTGLDCCCHGYHLLLHRCCLKSVNYCLVLTLAASSVTELPGQAAQISTVVMLFNVVLISYLQAEGMHGTFHLATP